MSLKRISELCPLCDAPLLLDEPVNVVFCQNPKCGYKYWLGKESEEHLEWMSEMRNEANDYLKQAAEDEKIKALCTDLYKQAMDNVKVIIEMDPQLKKEFGLDG